MRIESRISMTKEELDKRRSDNRLCCQYCAGMMSCVDTLCKCHDEDNKLDRLLFKNPLFTTKHYKAIAERFNIEVTNNEGLDTEFTLGEIVSWFCEILKQDNSKFDADKFWKEVTK